MASSPCNSEHAGQDANPAVGGDESTNTKLTSIPFIQENSVRSEGSVRSAIDANIEQGASLAKGSVSKSQGLQFQDVDREVEDRMSRRRSRVSGRVSKGAKATDDGDMKAVFVDAAAMKEKVRQTLCKPTHKVSDFYKTSGVWQAIARNMWFENITLAVISFNALWIAIDTDLNTSDILLNAHPVFLVAENFFCGYFFFEWLVRFLAFRRKRDGLRDKWFTFDSGMVLMMVLETWVMTLVTLTMGSAGSGGMGNASILRIARLLRLSRMARMARLLRAMPELMILIKGMVAACRSVFFTLFLLVIIMYVFAIAFTQLTTDVPIGKSHFESVPSSMYTLLIYGTLLDDIGTIARMMGDQAVYLNILFFSYVLLAALTVMNMLIGVLCEVVSAVAATEREEMLVGYVNRKVRKIVEELDKDGGGSISKDEFVQILENIEAVKALQDVGVDVVGLVDFADVIFEDEEELSFVKFMEVVLQLRGSNVATVKDVVDLRKLVHTESMRINLILSRMETKFETRLSEGFVGVMDFTRQITKTLENDEGDESHVVQSNFGEDRQEGTPPELETSDHHKKSAVESLAVANRSPHPNDVGQLLEALPPESVPYTALPASKVQLMIERSGHTTPNSEPGDELCSHSIPLESDTGVSQQERWRGGAAAVNDRMSLDVLSRLKGPWTPCTLDALPCDGSLRKVLEMPAYWTALRHNDLLSPNPFLQHHARIMADLDLSSASERVMKAQQVSSIGHTSNFQRGLEAPWVPVSLQSLRAQIADLGKVMSIGLYEVQRIQQELSICKATDRQDVNRVS